MTAADDPIAAHRRMARDLVAAGPLVPDEGLDDPFLWAEIHPAPDGRRLAEIGCDRACPYEVVVYDFETPMEMPRPGPVTPRSPEGDEERTCGV